MNVLFTGGNGFVGSFASQKLTELGYCVENLSHQEFDHDDFTRLTDMHRDGRNVKPDIVVHCAWPRLSDIHDLAHLEFATESIAMMEECKRNGIRVLNIGSHNEYGVKFEPAHEEMACEPIDTYGLAKLMVTLHAKKLGFNTLRLFAVYGKGGRNFKSVYENSTKYASAENVKDFIPVGMVAQAIERMLHAQHLYGEIINVCSGSQESARELVLSLIPNDEVNRELKVEQLMQKFNTYPQRQYEPSQWLGDTTKMTKLLNIKP